MSVKMNKKAAGAAILATGMVAGVAPAGAAPEYKFNYDSECLALAITDVTSSANGAAWEGEFLNGNCYAIEAKLYVDIKGAPGYPAQSLKLLREYAYESPLDMSFDFAPQDSEFAQEIGHHWCFRTRKSGQWYSEWQVIQKNGSTSDVCE